MGKSFTPKYAMTMRCAGIQATDACWRGRATEKRLRAHLVAYNESLKPGGVNARIGETFGIERARAKAGSIVTNDHRRIVVVSVTL